MSLDYYKKEGYHPQAVKEYLLTILNSNFEEWRIENPDAPMEEFEIFYCENEQWRRSVRYQQAERRF